MLRPLAASFDRNFLETVQNSFFTSLDRFIEALPFFLGVLGVVAILAVGVGLFNFIRRRLRGRAAPVGLIIRPQEIRTVLDRAIQERSRLDLRFLPADSSRKTMPCALLDMTATALTLDPPSFVEVRPDWMGRQVECFFRHLTPKGHILFYTFESTVLGVNSRGNRTAQLDLALPAVMRLEQKRSFLRIDPPSQYFLGLALWLDSLDAGVFPPPNIKTWGRPALVFAPDKSRSPVMISNISASGLRLSIRHEAARQARLAPQLGGRMLILLDLYEPETERKKRFWLRCRLQNIHEDFSTRDLEIGLQIIAFGRPMLDEVPYELAWHAVGEDGVESLAVWVMRRHLELYREKGLEQ
ncbi:PilZ domain-containing protein [Megalodesulfovibrio gigas]|nr:hypothetical protein [Megalodesulfovibrio gigas]